MDNLPMKDLVDSLSNPEITKRDYDANLKAIEKHIEIIWSFICQISKRGRYDNDENVPLEFNPTQDFINMGNAYEFHTEDLSDEKVNFDTHNDYYPYDNGFPKELLCDNNWLITIQTNINQAVNRYVEERKALREKNKLKRAKEAEKADWRKQVKASILQKSEAFLTKEEYAWLKQKLLF